MAVLIGAEKNVNFEQGSLLGLVLIDDKLLLETIGEIDGGNGVIQVFNSNGTFESHIIDLSRYLTEIKNIHMVSILPNNTTINIYTATSSDFVTFSDWSLIDSNGQITSPQARFIKIKAEMIGNLLDSNIQLSDFKKDDTDQFETNKLIEIDNGIRLIKDHTNIIDKDNTWVEDGNLFKLDLKKDLFRSIDKTMIVID